MFAYGLVPLENYMALEGMGIESISQGPCVYFRWGDKSLYHSAGHQKVKPRRVVMTFGTNNASGQFTRESFIDAYRDAITAIQDSPPVLRRHHQRNSAHRQGALLPLTSQWKRWMISIRRWKNWRRSWTPFLNSSEALKGGDGYAKPDYVIGDGCI